jgi:hypothetical protein
MTSAKGLGPEPGGPEGGADAGRATFGAEAALGFATGFPVAAGGTAGAGESGALGVTAGVAAGVLGGALLGAVLPGVAPEDVPKAEAGTLVIAVVDACPTGLGGTKAQEDKYPPRIQSRMERCATNISNLRKNGDDQTTRPTTMASVWRFPSDVNASPYIFG